MTNDEAQMLESIFSKMTDEDQWQDSPAFEFDDRKVIEFNRKEVNLLKRLLYNASSEKTYYFSGNELTITSNIEFTWLRGVKEDGSECIYMFLPDYSTLSDVITIWNTIIGLGYKKFKLPKLEVLANDRNRCTHNRGNSYPSGWQH